MDFSVNAFSQSLFEMILESNQFPFMRDEALDKAKHSKRSPLHLKNAIRQDALKFQSDNTAGFEIGSAVLEMNHPYYHILEDAPVIRKRGKGTKKTKGSQAEIENVGERDYGRVSWNGKTFTKEYDRNVRGSRKRVTSVSHWTEDYAGNNVFVNREANAYANTHYKYFEGILNGGVVDRLAMQFGLKRKRTENTGLGEEYAMQDESRYTTNMLDIFDSFNLGE